jgi:hypothetical protein
MLHLSLLHKHLKQLITHATGRTPMWTSSLDLNTLQYPSDVNPTAGQRVYREIAGPRGSVIYWDVPQLSLCHRIAQLTGDTSLSEAADAYVRHFLSIAVGNHGLWAIGNHYYYDLTEDRFMVFGYAGPTRPDDPADRSHVEHRPLMLDWDVFWRVDPAATEAHLRAFGDDSVDGGFAGKGGHFDRHTSRLSSGTVYSFSESGGILTESMAWLAKKLSSHPGTTPRLHRGHCLRLAKRVARFTFESRNPTTGLVPVQNSTDRWDRRCATSEIGLWAGSILNAFDLTGDGEYLAMASDAVAAFVDHAWDESRGAYFGKLDVCTARPDLSVGDNRPGVHTDLWNAYFPDHEYGIALGETAVRLWRATHDGRFATAARRLAQQLMLSRPGSRARSGHGAYAETFGRGIQFLITAADALGEPSLLRDAQGLAADAVKVLYHAKSGLFRGHAGEDRYDAVDGVGILGEALLNLDAI